MIEFTPWLINENGPAASKGVVYFIRGWSGGLGLDEFHLTPYLTKTLAENGWDVIGAKYPNRAAASAERYQSVSHAADAVRARTAALKAQGYKRVVIAGQSWGAWVAVAAAQASDFAGDALWLVVPNIYGPRTDEHGRANRTFALNKEKFAALVPALHTPTVLSTFGDDQWDMGGVSALLNQHFHDIGVASLLIDKPGGFIGHFSGWLPVYDYAFGACIRAFLDSGRVSPCAAPPLLNTDFRSIVTLSQIGDVAAKQIVSAAPLAGKRFVAFNLSFPGKPFDYLYSYDSGAARSAMSPFSQKTETVAFHDGDHCAAGACTLLVQWSAQQILEFDRKSGNLRSWWTQL